MAKDQALKATSLAEITSRLEIADRSIIAIDGPAGAGKTTLANRIADRFSRKSAIVHMDDLYDGWDSSLTPKLTRTLVNQILVPVWQGKDFGYRKYDWLTARFGEPNRFSAPDLLIVEGVGSGQRATGKYLTELIWIDIEPEVGLTRVLARDGEYLHEEMLVWQMREYEHFKAENTRDRATIRLDGKLFI
jgi:uridine kinase